MGSEQKADESKPVIRDATIEMEIHPVAKWVTKTSDHLDDIERRLKALESQGTGV